MPVKFFVLALASIAAAASASTHARDAAAGKLKAAQVCNVCHGVNGLSTQPNAPHLAGQPAIYIAEQMKAYRNGNRKNEVMAVIAKSLTEQDIDNLAAWYESIKITAEVPK
jgi:cytochrome c553